MEIDVEVNQTPAAVIVTVRGEVDLETSPTLRESLQGIDDREPVVIDLSEVTFLDSSGLSELVQAHERLAGAGGLRLVVNGDGIRRVLEVSGLADVFSTFDSVDHATQST